jgi:dihydroorotase
MEDHDLILNIHGEMVSSKPDAFAKEEYGREAVTVMNAESRFLPQLHKLHVSFPNLRIVLEHVSTKEALDAVRKCGPKVEFSPFSIIPVSRESYISLKQSLHHV